MRLCFYFFGRGLGHELTCMANINTFSHTVDCESSFSAVMFYVVGQNSFKFKCWTKFQFEIFSKIFKKHQQNISNANWSLWGRLNISFTFVCGWHKRFIEGCQNVGDDECPGQPSTPWMIVEIVNIDKDTVWKSLHENINKSLCQDGP